MKTRISIGLFVALGLVVNVEVSWAQGHITALRELGHDTSPPLDKIPPLPPEAGPTQEVALHRTHGPFAAPQPQIDQVLQSTATSTLSTTSGKDILGLGNGFTGPNSSFTVQFIPPDTNGAAGETQFVEWINASFAVFDKSTGNPTYGPAAGNTLWSGFGGACQRNNSGDPIAQYDKLANRWVLMQPVFKSPYTICVAVSTSPDATGSYHRYAFPVPNSVFPDYPKLGVWRDGYYLTYNQFQGNSFSGAAACAMDRNNMLLGNAATMQCFAIGSTYGSLLPGDLDGTTLPPVNSPDYFLNYDSNFASLDLWRFHVDWATPANSTLTGPTNIPVAAFSEACGGGVCVPQAGTTQQVDSLGDRLMYRLAYRNFGSYESLHANHSVNTGSSAGNTGVRWYELRNTGTGFGLSQEGTYAPDSNYRWMGSIAQDKNGDIALGYSVSSSTMSPTIRFTGRVPTDAPGLMESENDILTALSIPTGSQTSSTRWGDYSSMAIDPVDDCTFWYANEYQPTNGNAWSTRIASFSFTGCGGAATPDFSISTLPGSLTLTQGQHTTSTVTVTALNGFTGIVSFSLSGCPSLPSNACTISPGSVTGSGSSTLTVTTDSTTPTGSYTIIVTGTSGSLKHSATVSLTVNAPAATDFTISATPGSQGVRRGSRATYSVTLTRSGGYKGTVNLSVAGVPSNATGSFSPSSISGGSGSSTLTVSTTNSTVTGTYTLTITGTDSTGSPSHSTTVGLKVR